MKSPDILFWALVTHMWHSVYSCTGTVHHAATPPPPASGCMTCSTTGLQLFTRTNILTDNAAGCKQLVLYCGSASNIITFNNGTINPGQTGQIILQCGQGGWVFDGTVITEMGCAMAG